MRNFNFKPLVGVRTKKDEFSDKMIATSVNGNFRISPKVAVQLGVVDYGTVSLFSHTDEDTQETFVFIAKGHDGTIMYNEDGTPQTAGERNLVVYAENDPADGSLVRTTTKDSNMLTCTSAAAWKALGGSTDKELELSVTSIGVMEYPLPSGTMVEGEVFELVVVAERKVEKRKRATDSDKKDEASADNAIEQDLAQEGFVEEEL